MFLGRIILFALFWMTWSVVSVITASFFRDSNPIKNIYMFSMFILPYTALPYILVGFKKLFIYNIIFIIICTIAINLFDTAH